MISGSSAAEQTIDASISNDAFQDYLKDDNINVITLAGGNYNGLSNLNITKGVTIRSSGQVNIIGNNERVLFNITSRDVNFINLNISGYQTVITSNRGGLSITGCNISATNDTAVNIHTPTVRTTPGGINDGLQTPHQLTDIYLVNNIITSSVHGLPHGLYGIAAHTDPHEMDPRMYQNSVVTIYYDEGNHAFGDKNLSVYLENNTIIATNTQSTSIAAGLSIYLRQEYISHNDVNRGFIGDRDPNSFGENCSTIVTLIGNNITGIYRGAYIRSLGSNITTITLINNSFQSSYQYNSSRNDFGQSAALYLLTGCRNYRSFDMTVNILVSGNNITGSPVALMWHYGHRPNVNMMSNVLFVGNNFKAYGGAEHWPSMAVFIGNMRGGLNIHGVSFLNNTLEGDYGFQFNIRPGGFMGDHPFYDNGPGGEDFTTVTLTDFVIQGNTILANKLAFGFSYEEIQGIAHLLNRELYDATGDPNFANNGNYYEPAEIYMYGSHFQTLINLTVNYNRIVAPIGVDVVFKNLNTRIFAMIRAGFNTDYPQYPNFDYRGILNDLFDLYLDKGYTVINMGSNFDFNWWGQNDISGLFHGFTAENGFTIPNNHYLLDIINTTDLDKVYLGDELLFFYLLLSTSEDHDMSKLPFLPMFGTFENPVDLADSFDIDYDSALAGFYQKFSALYTGQYSLTSQLDNQVAVNAFLVTKEPTTIVVDPVNDKVGRNTTLSAKLTDSDNKPIVGGNVDFYVDGEYVGSAVTDGNGVARIPNYVFNKEGNYNITAKYNGTTERYLESEGRNIADISKIKTTIKIEVDGDIVTVTLTDEYGNLLEGKEVTLTDAFGNILGIGITNDKGQVQFTYTGNNIIIRATFNGDDIYYGSETVFRYGPENTAKTTEENPKNTTENPPATNAATMKHTGIPLIAILLVLLSTLGICITKKQK